MAWQGLKLNLRVSQKQILTPGLVQMVSVLALNRLELREMINQEMIANPVLEEQSEEPTQTDNYSDETFLKAETEKVPEKPEANPFDEFDVGSFFTQRVDRPSPVAIERDDLLRRSEGDRGQYHRQFGRERLSDGFRRRTDTE